MILLHSNVDGHFQVFAITLCFYEHSHESPGTKLQKFEQRLYMYSRELDTAKLFSKYIEQLTFPLAAIRVLTASRPPNISQLHFLISVKLVGLKWYLCISLVVDLLIIFSFI